MFDYLKLGYETIEWTFNVGDTKYSLVQRGLGSELDSSFTHFFLSRNKEQLCILTCTKLDSLGASCGHDNHAFRNIERVANLVSNNPIISIVESENVIDMSNILDLAALNYSKELIKLILV